jgi:hypothetical protein
MATLGSPGVQVQVIDESFYTPAAPGTVPLIFVATAENKSNAAGTGTAQGTLKSKAGNVWIITSQRDLTDTFGVPKFQTDESGNPIHGDERNEYGLQAAYSLLGATSRAYVVRADLDLAQLVPSGTAPVGAAPNGRYWIDTTDTRQFGVNEWNASTQKFTVKAVKIVDDINVDTVPNDGSLVPLSSFGSQGDYAMVVTADNTNALFYKTASNVWTPVTDGFDGGKTLVMSAHTSYPDFTGGFGGGAGGGGEASNGSVWVKTTSPGFGANWVIKYYSSATKLWSKISAPLYTSTRNALEKLDYAGGGANISVGSLFVETNYGQGTGANYRANFKVWRRNASGPTTISATSASDAVRVSASTFFIRETLASSTEWSDQKEVSIPGNGTIKAGFAAAVSAAGLTNISATYDSVTNKITLSHALGGDFELQDGDNSPLADIGFDASVNNLYVAPQFDNYDFIASNWKPLSYQASSTVPNTAPTTGTLWFNSDYDADILYHNGTTWVGYRDVTAFPNTDPAGPLVKATAPKNGDRSDGYNFANGDIWISTADMERYGKDIYVWNSADEAWVKQDPTDQTSPEGWVFADARWAVDGTLSTPSTIAALLESNFLDTDAPDPAEYPRGTRLWNTRRSGNNVKRYVTDYVNTTANNARYNDQSMADYAVDRWVSYQSVNEDGSGRFGRQAQRGVVTAALNAAITNNLAVLDTDTLTFNLIATPGYVETIPSMTTLNANRGYTAFVVGDTPFRLEPTATALTAWGTNASGAPAPSEDGAGNVYDDYGCMALFYPSGFTTDNTGKNIVVPPSHMMLRTIINSDAKSYPWFAPAGTRRGGVDNASSVGYIDGEGEFKSVALYEGLRNVLQDPTVQINPIATLPGVGVVNFGQKTRARNASSLDRINVARLIAYLRRQLAILAKPYLFEPNDQQTRREIKGAADSLLIELVGQRALYDFVTVCDSTNNTPARIDRSELWLDIAVEPVKAVEFIYIPLRIKNTGEIAAGV